ARFEAIIERQLHLSHGDRRGKVGGRRFLGLLFDQIRLAHVEQTRRSLFSLPSPLLETRSIVNIRGNPVVEELITGLVSEQQTGLARLLELRFNLREQFLIVFLERSFRDVRTFDESVLDEELAGP